MSVSSRRLKSFKSCNRTPTRLHVLNLALATGATLLCSDLRRHFSAKSICEGKLIVPGFLLINLVCLLARCWVVVDDAAFTVSNNPSGFWVLEVPKKSICILCFRLSRASCIGREAFLRIDAGNLDSWEKLLQQKLLLLPNPIWPERLVVWSVLLNNSLEVEAANALKDLAHVLRIESTQYNFVTVWKAYSAEGRIIYHLPSVESSDYPEIRVRQRRKWRPIYLHCGTTQSFQCRNQRNRRSALYNI